VSLPPRLPAWRNARRLSVQDPEISREDQASLQMLSPHSSYPPRGAELAAASGDPWGSRALARRGDPPVREAKNAGSRYRRPGIHRKQARPTLRAAAATWLYLGTFPHIPDSGEAPAASGISDAEAAQ
jgi:hypothetical protein